MNTPTYYELSGTCRAMVATREVAPCHSRWISPCHSGGYPHVIPVGYPHVIPVQFAMSFPLDIPMSFPCRRESRDRRHDERSMHSPKRPGICTGNQSGGIYPIS